jgi:DNA invertase Pin-like site-specific DNA recombinase
MPARTGDAIGEARQLLERRLRELDDERARLQRALGEMSAAAPRGRRGPGRPRGSRTRRRRGSTRADQAVKTVEASPGITASEIARKLGIQPNYMYRVMADLQKEGRVRKQGRGYHPA